jgi:hypothetical protein
MPVKAGGEFAGRAVHKDNRRAFGHADDPAKPVEKPYNITGAEPERMPQGLPDDADKLALVRVFGMAFDVFHKNPSGWGSFKP